METFKEVFEVMPLYGKVMTAVLVIIITVALIITIIL